MKTKLLLFLELLLGLPKSIRINFKYLPFGEAIKLPILVSFYCTLWTLHGKIKIEAPIKTGMIKLGIGAYGLIDHKHCRSIFTNSSGGGILFKGTARFGPGFKLANNGELEIGDNFNMTGNSTIICEKKIEIGSNCLFSWEDLVMDTDYHSVCIDGHSKDKCLPVFIGDHCWIGCRATILKGSSIGNDSVVAAGAVVSRKFSHNNIIAGVPGKVVKEDCNWEK